MGNKYAILNGRWWWLGIYDKDVNFSRAGWKNGTPFPVIFWHARKFSKFDENYLGMIIFKRSFHDSNCKEKSRKKVDKINQLPVNYRIRWSNLQHLESITEVDQFIAPKMPHFAPRSTDKKDGVVLIFVLKSRKSSLNLTQLQNKMNDPENILADILTTWLPLSLWPWVSENYYGSSVRAQTNVHDRSHGILRFSEGQFT